MRERERERVCVCVLNEEGNRVFASTVLVVVIWTAVENVQHID